MYYHDVIDKKGDYLNKRELYLGLCDKAFLNFREAMLHYRGAVYDYNHFSSLSSQIPYEEYWSDK
mgnify:CR=1 FL=1